MLIYLKHPTATPVHNNTSMLTLPFDPGQGEQFKAAIRRLPGYPAGEELPIRAMLFASDALFRLPELLAHAGAQREEPLVVVMDQRVMRRSGEELKPLILQQLQTAGWSPTPLWLEADATGQVHTDFSQINRVKAHLTAKSAVVAVGAGTVTDIAKHACYLHQQEQGVPLPFVVYQTANSVSAYTSNMAPVFMEGVKRTLPSRYPDVLVCDLETLRDAPKAMTVAGVGDLLAACGSFADWYLAYRLGLDSTYNTFAQTLVGPLDELLLSHAEAIRTASLDGMALLAKLIALAGLAMSLSHATAPLSGYEHVISHVLDLLAEQAHRPLAQHGAQVALATILTTAVYRHFLTEFDPTQVDPTQCYPSAETMAARIHSTFAPVDPSGQVAAECWTDYQQKLTAWHTQRDHFAAFRRDWPTVRQDLEALVRPPELVIRILRAVEAPLGFAELDPPVQQEDVRFAFQNAPLIRRRLTLGDLFLFLGWDQETLWQQAWTSLVKQ